MRNESPVTNWEPPMSEKGLDESYAVIREALEKNNRGNVVNSLQNCVLALTHDPCWADTSAGTCSTNA